jgi:hypothetical protein
VNLLCSLGRPEQRARRFAEATDAASRTGFRLDVFEPPAEISSDDDLARAESDLKAGILLRISSLDPDVVISPHVHDGHHGHEVVARATKAALETVAYPESPPWWTWGLWSEVAAPTVLTPFDQARMDEILGCLAAYEGELERNDYSRLLLGRSISTLPIASERIFGFGSPIASELPFGETIMEQRLTEHGWELGEGRLLDALSPFGSAIGKRLR